MSHKFRIIVCLFLLTILSNQIQASHYRGGEITWTCQGNGMFVFQLKYYRDCNGIAGATSVTLITTVPTVPSFNLDLVQQQDISHGGFQSNGTTPCPTCVQGSSTNPINGLVEELIYESLPVQLVGVPPATGWVFSVGECCRPALDNISLASSIGYGFQAKMYPYNNQNTQVCFDSSPFFAESPEPMFCTGYPVRYNQFAVDADRDSIVYSWGVPLTEVYGPIPFAPGYSVTSQLPGPTQNAANTGASIDPTTGAITFTSFTGGLFMTKVTVTSYKNGIKTAEMFREFMLALNNNCPPVMGGVQNFTPDVNPPFYNPATGLQTEYIDTVYAGDIVNFNLTFTDFDLFTNGTGQIISVEAAGDIFGLNFTDPTQGCTQPPCATFLTPLPASFPVAGNMTFNWATTEDHLYFPGTQTLNNKYNFTVTAKDNYCPANGINTVTASIVILPRPLFAPPNLRCASVNSNGSVSLPHGL